MGQTADDNPAPRKTADGCRPDQLFGLWSIEESRFQRLVAMAKGADLEKLRVESAAAAERTAAQPLYSQTSDGIAVIEISGPMTKYSTSFQALFGGTSTLRTREALRAASRDPEVMGIMVVIDSPGGTVAGMADLAEDIRRADTKKPVYTYAADFAASAALWALSQGRQAFGNANAEIGSIGCFHIVEDTSKQYDQQGVKVHVISSAPPIKGAGVDGTEITPLQLAEWERRVKDQAALFVSELAAGRRMGKEKAAALATGQVWVAAKAREFGLIDDVVSLDEAMRRLRSEAMEEKDVKAAMARADEATAALAAEKLTREKTEAALAETTKRLKALETEKRSARFVGEAEAIGAPKAFAATLDAIEAAVGPEVYGALQTQLKAFAEQVKAGAVFEEKGGGGGGSASDDFEALSQAALKAGRVKTLTEAYKLVSKENPKAYQEHAARVRKGAA
jgi:signal peptide peptidase SppA